MENDLSDDPLPPAFFPVGLNLVGRRCIVIGDDREAEEKSTALREAGADLLRVRDPAALQPDDLFGAFFVISTPQDAAFSERLRVLADKQHFLLCTIDQPRFGFVAMAAIVKSGPARIAISTGGVAPGVGKIIKHALQRALDRSFELFLAELAALRLRNRALLDSSEERRAAMLAASDGFDLDVTLKYPGWFEDLDRS